MNRAILVVVVMLFVVGCSAQQQIRRGTAEVEQAAIAANDWQLSVSEKSLCSCSLSAIRRKYGDDPEMLEHVLGLCGWSRRNIETVTDWVIVRP